MVHANSGNMNDEEKPSFVLFGRDLLKIPCLRTSLLYSISSYIGVGLVTFLCTSKPRLASHVGFTAFVTVTFGYYMNCRVNYTKNKLEVAQIQQALHKAAVLEGTEAGKTASKLESA